MSHLKIKSALLKELRLHGLQGPGETVTENTDTPTPSASAFQDVWFLFATTENPQLGTGLKRERGYMQVDLRYPLNEGSGPADTRAELLKTAFKQGLSLDAGGFTVVVDRDPSSSQGKPEGARWVVSVIVPFYADIFGG